jgi:hypothetical protein
MKLVALFLAFVGLNSSFAQTPLPPPEWRFETFGDYAYKINGDSLSQDLQYSGQARDFQAFQIRRALLGVTFPFSKDLALSAAIEHNDRITLGGGQFGLFLKTAFLQWKNILPKSTLQLGLMPTPTWLAGMSERVWGFRGVEKTISDMRNLGIATDLGIALRGNAGENNELGYMAMVANGSSIRAEADKYKKYYAMVNYRFIDNLVAELYADYEDRSSIKYKRTLKGILAWDSKHFTVGVEAVNQLDHCNCPPNLEKNRVGISTFARAPLMEDPSLVAFARFDNWDLDTRYPDQGFTENFITAGLDLKPHPTIHLIPNIWVNTYGSKQNGIDAPDPQLAARLTFWYIYN